MTLSDFITVLLERYNKTELAQATGLNEKTLRCWRNGKIKNLSKASQDLIEGFLKQEEDENLLAVFHDCIILKKEYVNPLPPGFFNKQSEREVLDYMPDQNEWLLILNIKKYGNEGIALDRVFPHMPIDQQLEYKMSFDRKMKRAELFGISEDFWLSDAVICLINRRNSPIDYTNCPEITKLMMESQLNHLAKEPDNSIPSFCLTLHVLEDLMKSVLDDGPDMYCAGHYQHTAIVQNANEWENMSISDSNINPEDICPYTVGGRIYMELFLSLNNNYKSSYKPPVFIRNKASGRLYSQFVDFSATTEVKQVIKHKTGLFKPTYLEFHLETKVYLSLTDKGKELIYWMQGINHQILSS